MRASSAAMLAVGLGVGFDDTRLGEREGAFYDGKRAAGRYFLTHELAKVGPMLDLLASGDQLFNEVDPATF